MKKKDYITIFSVILLIVLAFIATRFQSRQPGEYVKVIKDNNLIGIYPLNEEKEIDLGSNTLIIGKNSVYMAKADCADGLCIKQHAISNNGEQIVCLPNKISASIIASNEGISKSGFFFNTYVTVTLYDSDDEKILDDVMEICKTYELICSRTNESSELYKLNHRLTNEVVGNYSNKHYTVSDELYDMISIGLNYSKLSNDTFDIAIAPVSELWDFSSGKEIIPDEDAIQNALRYTSSSDIILNNDGSISFANENTMIDLGAMAKGYIADRIKEYLIEKGINSATISLGGNVLCVGNKLGKDFNIGIQKPFDNTGSAITNVEICDKSVVTSGIYERYFKKGKKIYHHILNSKTGYPVENDIYGITVISDNSVDGDCLSTWLFSLGSDGALEYAKAHPEIQVIIIDNNYNILK